MRKRKTFFAAVALVLAGTMFAGDVVIFDGSKNIGEVVANPAVKREGDALVSTGNFEFDGRWDLSKNLDLAIDIENTSGEQWIPLQIGIYDASGNETAEWMQMYTMSLPPKKRMELVMEYPRPPKHPEIAEKIKGMRASPFGGGDRMALPKDYKNILKVRIVRPWINSGPAVILRRVVAREHDLSKLPAYYNMTEKEFYPFIDKYGQFKFKEWPGKVHSDADLKAAAEREQKELAAHPTPADRDRFGGWTAGGKREATGHFRTEKIDGKWWLVDPDGNLFWSHGVVRVTPFSAITPLDGREFYFEDLPQKGDPLAHFYTTMDELLRGQYEKRGIKKTYDFSGANIYRKYGKNWREIYAELAHKRLHAWGLNTIANSSDPQIFLMRKTPYVDRFRVDGPSLTGSDGWWWPFRDPFAPEFRKDVERNLKLRKDQLNDPWCIGFFVDNELNWGDETSLAKWTIFSSASCTAKKVFAEDLKAKYGTIEKLNSAWGASYKDWDDFVATTKVPEKANVDDLKTFSQKVIAEYFKAISEEIKKLAPNKLYMGCRFAHANPTVIKIAAKYCDVLSYNLYRDDLKGFRLPDGVDKPVMVGEWHFGALDRGLFHPTLLKKANQNERAWAYYNYAKSALENPQVVGIHWHQFSDQATTGRFDGEDFQVGFTDVCDNPYPETISKVREIGEQMYKIRRGE